MKNDSLLIHSKDHCKVCRRPVGIGYIVGRRIYCADCFNEDQELKWQAHILSINGDINAIDGSKL